jgi:hypothetical protein
MTLTNSTVSGNSAVWGGGVHNAGVATFNNTTVSANSAITLGGGVSTLGTVDLKNTIIAKNAGGDCSTITSGSSGVFTTKGSNLDGDNSCGLKTSWPYLDLPSKNPQLLPLANYGGLTETQVPAAGSPAIDAVWGCTDASLWATITNDQRGVARPPLGVGVGLKCDIGSVEVRTVDIT